MVNVGDRYGAGCFGSQGLSGAGWLMKLPVDIDCRCLGERVGIWV